MGCNGGLGKTAAAMVHCVFVLICASTWHVIIRSVDGMDFKKCRKSLSEQYFFLR
jgi:hypothetical protein